MNFDYKHGNQVTINTELGTIILTYIMGDKLEIDPFGMKQYPNGLVNENDTYWLATCGDFDATGLIAEEAVKNLYLEVARKKVRNLKLDLPI